MPEPRKLTLLYQKHSPAVFRRARGILKSEAEASEVVQDLFLSLFEKPSQYQGKSSITTFLYAATTHACLNRLRNEQNRQRLREERELILSQQYSAPRLSADQLLVLRTALTQMPEELAQVAVYRFMDGLSHDEIAEVMKCSRRQVGKLLSRVREWSEDNAPDSSPLADTAASC